MKLQWLGGEEKGVGEEEGNIRKKVEGRERHRDIWDWKRFKFKGEKDVVKG